MDHNDLFALSQPIKPPLDVCFGWAVRGDITAGAGLASAPVPATTIAIISASAAAAPVLTATHPFSMCL